MVIWYRINAAESVSVEGKGSCWCCFLRSCGFVFLDIRHACQPMPSSAVLYRVPYQDKQDVWKSVFRFAC